MRWASRPADLEGADLVILPGSKHLAEDAEWLRQRGLDRAIIKHATSGGRTLGICGGAMLLGDEVTDPGGVEGATTGLGLLPLATTMHPDKLTRKVSVSFSGLSDPWARLNGIDAYGYEIRNGRVAGDNVRVSPHLWVEGSVMATTVHGLLENPKVLEALTGLRVEPVLEQTFDLLAEAVDTHLDTGFLLEMVES